MKNMKVMTVIISCLIIVTFDYWIIPCLSCLLMAFCWHITHIELAVSYVTVKLSLKILVYNDSFPSTVLWNTDRLLQNTKRSYSIFVIIQINCPAPELVVFSVWAVSHWNKLQTYVFGILQKLVNLKIICFNFLFVCC